MQWHAISNREIAWKNWKTLDLRPRMKEWDLCRVGSDFLWVIIICLEVLNKYWPILPYYNQFALFNHNFYLENHVQTQFGKYEKSAIVLSLNIFKEIYLSSEGSFGFAYGPGSKLLKLGPFTLPRPFGLEFCYYSSSFGTKFSVQLELDNNDQKLT